MTQSALAARDSLFADRSLDLVVSEGTGTEPWRSFNAARDCLARGDNEEALKILEAITVMRGIEARYQLQAWYFLRQAGRQPPSNLEKHVLGAVVEVGLESAYDVLAAYADLTAHYYNYSGAGMVWMRPDSSLDSLIGALLSAAAAILPHIGPWRSPRRPPPSAGRVRVNILTPLGPHFGEGPFEALDRDALSRPMVQAATNLMRKLTSLPSGRAEPSASHS